MSEAQPAAPGSLQVGKSVKTLYSILMFVGFITFVVTFINDKQRAWESYLVAFFYFVTLGLGGIFFAAIQHMTNAGWSVNIRRLSESFTSFLPFGLVFGLIFLFGVNELYEWLHKDVVAQDHLLKHKSGYLNLTFFLIRFVGFFVLWILFSKLIVGNSLKQDENGDENLTKKNMPLSVGFIPVFALSFTFFSIDLLMSLEPHWFSTIFGVYTFAGLFQSTMAALILLIIYLMKKGMLRGFVDANHLHDLGKFLFAFTVFWAYIAFSQFMLIWYANLPEETFYIIARMNQPWATVSVLLIVFKFIVPFLALLPRWAKRTPAHLIAVCTLILVMQYVDLYWLVYPAHNRDEIHFGLQEVGVFLGFAGLFIFAVTRFLSKHQIVPIKDPRIQESLHHHVTY